MRPAREGCWICWKDEAQEHDWYELQVCLLDYVAYRESVVDLDYEVVPVRGYMVMNAEVSLLEADVEAALDLVVVLRSVPE